MSARFLLFAFFAMVPGLYQPACSQAPGTENHLDHLGLIGELAYYKQTAENHAIRVFNNKQLPDSVKSQVILRYNDLRVIYEQMVLQLIADLHAKKRLWLFKNIDKYFKYGKVKNRRKVLNFIDNWENMTRMHAGFMSYPDAAMLNDLAGIPDLNNDELELAEEEGMDLQGGIKLNPLDPVGSAGSLFNIYKNINAKNALRTRNITEMLYGLRLRHAAELVVDEPAPVEVKMEGK